MARLIINANRKGSAINRNIYGHFCEHLGRCIYGGLFVGEDSAIPHTKGIRNDVAQALRNIQIPVLRWPGGCFADEYHWKDAIGPAKARKRMVNTHWGGVVEDNSFGTHEFMELCRQLGCEPYVNGNVGSGSIQEMQEWIEYMTFDGESPMAALRRHNGQPTPWRLKYFGIGNENWGYGGNMRPEYYADVYRRYQTYVRDYGSNQIFRIACGANVDDYHWTKVLLEKAADKMDALTLHYYTLPTGDWSDKGNATGFSEAEYYATLKRALRMEELVENHSRIMDYYDPARRIGLIVDEWGTWYNVEPGTNPGFLYQQNTMRDALVAALTLNIFNRHSNRIVMANLAQTVNVLQALILTEGDKMLLTPTYHVFDLYKGHMDATLLDSYVECSETGPQDARVPQLDVTASEDLNGKVHITLVNLSANEAKDIDCFLSGVKGKRIMGRLLSGSMDDRNDFDSPHYVKVHYFKDIILTEEGCRFTIPPCAVMEIIVQ
ncbi:MAG: alpha-L-arabinofuranosidase C-terminal domain-containing protein [Candidatus Limiplasma sp.]|nr:alpha-L-arabinofuranosidase C-terminal domain-containing protein [Candidatus Limiplasma sp.]